MFTATQLLDGIITDVKTFIPDFKKVESHEPQMDVEALSSTLFLNPTCLVSLDEETPDPEKRLSGGKAGAVRIGFTFTVLSRSLRQGDQATTMLALLDKLKENFDGKYIQIDGAATPHFQWEGNEFLFSSSGWLGYKFMLGISQI